MAEGSGPLSLGKIGSMRHGDLQVSEGLSQDKGSRRNLWYLAAELRQINELEPQQESSTSL